MASLEDLKSQIPIGQIAQQLGVDEQTAAAAVQAALPTLVGGLGANAQDPDGAASLQNALQQHAHNALLDGGVDINDIDTADGQKIVSNVFGTNTGEVVNALGGTPGGGGNELVGKLLPILAPIVLAYLAKHFSGQQPAPTGAAAGQSGGLGDVLGGLLGGGKEGTGLGDVLGELLGGSTQGGLGALLGGLLGGGKK